MKKQVYNCLDLKGLAVKAQDEGLISSLYDVVELLFEPEELIEVVGFIMEINKIGQSDINKDIEEIKK